MESRLADGSNALLVGALTKSDIRRFATLVRVDYHPCTRVKVCTGDGETGSYQGAVLRLFSQAFFRRGHAVPESVWRTVPRGLHVRMCAAVILSRYSQGTFTVKHVGTAYGIFDSLDHCRRSSGAATENGGRYAGSAQHRSLLLPVCPAAGSDHPAFRRRDDSRRHRRTRPADHHASRRHCLYVGAGNRVSEGHSDRDYSGPSYHCTYPVTRWICGSDLIRCHGTL